jgi:hypothetical protein
MDKHTLKVAMIIHAKKKNQNNNKKSISIAMETAKWIATITEAKWIAILISNFFMGCDVLAR